MDNQTPMTPEQSIEQMIEKEADEYINKYGVLDDIEGRLSMKYAYIAGRTKFIEREKYLEVENGYLETKLIIKEEIIKALKTEKEQLKEDYECWRQRCLAAEEVIYHIPYSGTRYFLVGFDEANEEWQKLKQQKP